MTLISKVASIKLSSALAFWDEPFNSFIPSFKNHYWISSMVSRAPCSPTPLCSLELGSNVGGIPCSCTFTKGDLGIKREKKYVSHSHLAWALWVWLITTFQNKYIIIHPLCYSFIPAGYSLMNTLGLCFSWLSQCWVTL